MASIRELAACIGVTDADISMLFDFFGFIRSTLPPDPTGAPVEVSLKRQVDRLEGLHFHVNVIRVGVEQFNDSDNQEIDYSTFKMRNIFNEVGIGVGRVQHFFVTTADADSLDTPLSKGDLKQLTQDWTVPNEDIDLFIPHNFSAVTSSGNLILGKSAIGGTCDNKDRTTGMTGATAGLWGGLFGTDETARTISHELGHYLGLFHRNGLPTNLMCQSGSVEPPGTIRTATELIEEQINNISNHCSMTSGC